MLKRKKAGLATKILVLLLLVYVAITLMGLRGKISAAEESVDSLQKQVAVQTQRNAELAGAIENSDDPEHIKNIAREKLNLVEPGEKVFYITD